MTKANIFISIAAYREFDLEATVLNAINNAIEPERLRFVICWQHSTDEALDQIADLPQVTLIDVPHEQSQGVCWARALIQTHYQGEAFALQLDGHHRFVCGWDRWLIETLEDLEATGVAKPVLTTYLPSFNPKDDPQARAWEAWYLGFDHFDASGVVFMQPAVLEETNAPWPTPFWSAHFSFSRGSFIEEVPVDPKGYFHGEEITIAVRGFTHGYDFYSPHELVAWHEYSRQGRRCHWQDHADWQLRNRLSIDRFNALLGVDGTDCTTDFGRHGLGSTRSVADYERFAGLCFKTRSVSVDTLHHRPPHPHADDNGIRPQMLISHARHVSVDLALLRDDTTQFVGLFANAADGEELYRRDISREEMDQILAESPDAGAYGCLMKVHASQAPAQLTIWPYHRDRGWGEPDIQPWPA